jgi:hypothetical protein
MGRYCGGNWRGIINKLDYIQGMGFDAIWISPVSANIEGSFRWGEPYHVSDVENCSRMMLMVGILDNRPNQAQPQIRYPRRSQGLVSRPPL